MQRRSTRIAAIVITLISTLVLPLSGPAGELTSADKEKATAQLARTRQELLASVSGLSKEQWNFKPAGDQWSIAETLEHIVLTEDALYKLVTQQVMKAPAGKPGRDATSGDKDVLRMIPDRSTKVQAPSELQPTGRWKPEEAVRQFEEARKRTKNLLDSTPGLRDHVIDSPLGQPLDAYQWVLYIAAHSERHTRQILEVKANPQFPWN